MGNPAAHDELYIPVGFSRQVACPRVRYGAQPQDRSDRLLWPTAWINGGSPTDGFLQFGLHTKEPFLGFYQGLAGSALIDWVYMLSMAGIGIALLFGILTRLAAIAGIVWMLIFYTASAIWPENNPFLDDHIVYAVILAGIAYVGAGRWLGLGGKWRRSRLVRKVPILE